MPRRGFTLIEITVVMAVLGLLLAMIATVLSGTLQIERVEAASFQRSLVGAALADEFRADVAQSETAPHKLDEWTKTPQCLILKHPGGEAIIYILAGGRLERLEKEGKRESRRQVPLPEDTEGVEFRAVEGNAGLLEIVVHPTQGKLPRSRPALSIQAALGGELR